MVVTSDIVISPNPIEYTLGSTPELAMNNVPYSFSYTTNKNPDCVVPMTMELRNAPNMATLEKNQALENGGSIVIAESFDIT